MTVRMRKTFVDLVQQLKAQEKECKQSLSDGQRRLNEIRDRLSTLYWLDEEMGLTEETKQKFDRAELEEMEKEKFEDDDANTPDWIKKVKEKFPHEPNGILFNPKKIQDFKKGVFETDILLQFSRHPQGLTVSEVVRILNSYSRYFSTEMTHKKKYRIVSKALTSLCKEGKLYCVRQDSRLTFFYTGTAKLNNTAKGKK